MVKIWNKYMSWPILIFLVVGVVVLSANSFTVLDSSSVLKGDINKDGVVNFIDVELLSSYIKAQPAMDMNNDFIIDTKDKELLEIVLNGE